MRWKVCRVGSLHAARMCAELGADFLGLHAIDGLDSQNESIYRSIGREMKSRFTTCAPVLVTKIRDPGALADMLRRIKARIVQIHSKLAPGELRSIVRQAERYLGYSVSAVAVISASDSDATAYCQQLTLEAEVIEFFLLDSNWRGGTGNLASLERIRSIREELKGYTFFVAGGLSPGNVAEFARETSCDGVDVQSGVEVTGRKGRQDPRKLRAFANAIGKREIGRVRVASPSSFVSLAIAGLPPGGLERIHEDIHNSSVDSIHLDEADGSLTPDFVNCVKENLNDLAKALPIVPVDIHIMTDSLKLLSSRIEDLASLHPSVRAIYAHSLGPLLEPSFVKELVAYANQLRFSAGVAFDASGYGVNEIAQSLRLLDQFGVRYVSIVGRSKRHDVNSFRLREVKLLDVLCKWSRANGTLDAIAIDRDLDEQRLQAFGVNYPNHLISGKWLLRSPDLERNVSKLRLVVDSIKARRSKEMADV